MMRTRSGSSGRSGGQAPKHAGLPVSGSFQLRTKPLRMSSSSSAVSNSLKQGILSPRRHSARASGRCPCAARWDAVVTASCEAFCEKNKLFLENKSSVTTTASCEAFCEGAWRSGRWYHPGVTTTASCEAFCEETFFVNGMQFESQPQLAVKPSVRKHATVIDEGPCVTTTASCEAFCESVPGAHQDGYRSHNHSQL